MALISGSGAQVSRSLNPQVTDDHGDKVLFRQNKLTKGQKANDSRRAISFSEYQQDDDL